MVSNFKKNTKSYIMFISLILIGIVFSILTDGVFINPRNLSNLARQTTVVGVTAIAMMFIIIANHIDLSIGAVLGCCGTIAAALQVWGEVGTPLAIIITLAVGAVIGMWNGFWVAYRKVPAFIVTLGGMLIFQGVKLGIGKGMSIAPMNEDFSFLGQGYLSIELSLIIGIIGAAAIIFVTLNGRKSKTKYGIDQPAIAIDVVKSVLLAGFIIGITLVLNSYQGMPVPVILLIALAVIFNFVANKTTYGRSVYAIGGNEEASNLAGIKTKKVTMYIFTIGGVLAAFAGILLTARLDSATAAAGDGMELDAIASCVIGGVSMSGGSGKISGALIGALIMAALDNGMSLINLETFWQFIVKGLVLTLAVWADMAFNEDK